MNERHTPETDARAYIPLLGASTVSADFARKLERERDEAREDTPWYSNGETKDEWLARQREKCAVLERESDEARENAERYRLEANAMMMQRDEAREALEYIAHSGLSARFLEDYAREFLKSRGGAK